MAGVELFRPQPRLEIPENQPKVPQLDFTPLNQIGNTIVEGQRRQAITAAVARATGPNGQLDVERAGAELARIPGALEEARPFLALAQQKAALAQSAGQHAATLAESRRAHLASEDLARQQYENPKPQYHVSPGEFGGPPRVIKTSNAGVEITEPTVTQAPVTQGQPRPQAPVPGSTDSIVPNPVKTEAVPAQQAVAPAPPAEQPRPDTAQPQTPAKNDQWLSSLPPEIQGAIRDVDAHPQLLDKYTGKERYTIERGVRRYNPAWQPELPGLSQNAIAVAAERLELGDYSATKNLGKGAQGARDLAAMWNELANNLVVKKGYTASEAAQYVSRRQQEFQASQAGLSAGARTGATREENLRIILNATDAAIPAVLEQSDKVWRGGFIPLNKIIQASGKVVVADPELRAFGISNLQLAEHWARAMNPTGVMRESDRNLALEYLSTADSPAAYKRAVEQVRTQIGREHDVLTKGRPSEADALRTKLEDARGRGKGASVTETEPSAGVPKIDDQTLAQLRANPTAALARAKAAIDQGASASSVKSMLNQIDPSLAGKLGL